MEEAFAGIDVAFAKRKHLPVVICQRRGSSLEPLPLRRAAAVPPRGRGNARALNPADRERFAEETVAYLRSVEREFGVAIRRIAIDSPSDPKMDGSKRRRCEVALDDRRISCFTTPSAREFVGIAERGVAHLATGGAQARLPGANQLWMLVGFELFRRLRREWECLEVFPQAIVTALGAHRIHKRHPEGLLAQLSAVAARTRWPPECDVRALDAIAYGSNHDRLDAYLAAWVASLPLERREALGAPPDDAIWIPTGSA